MKILKSPLLSSVIAIFKEKYIHGPFFNLTDLWLHVCKLIWVLILVAVWTSQASECVPLCQKLMAFGKGSTERSTFFSRFGPLSSYNQHFDIESKIIMRFVICTTWNSTPWGHNLLTLFTQKYDNSFRIFYNKTTTIGSEIETRLKVHSTNTICKMQQHKLFSRKNVLKFRPYCI